MLERIRENAQGMTAKIILGFIILTFAIAGIGSYTNNVDTSVAEVNGEKISLQEFEQAYQAQRNRMAQQFGDMFDTLASNPAYLANLRNGVLDNLINEKLLDQAARDLAIRISDEKLKETIRNMTEFQVDGQFDNNRYLAVINQSGFYQSSDFRDYLRVEMARRQLGMALVSGEFGLPYQAEQQEKLRNQTRDIKYAIVDTEQFKSQVEVTDEEITAFYQDNEDRFQTQEKVKVDYVLLDVFDIAREIEVTEADAKAYYDENIASFTKDEQRRISHILIEFGDDKGAAEQEIRTLANRIAGGDDFAELAKEFSADTFSGENGGDLEYLELGVMDEAFEEAALALENVNDVTDVVESEFGYHLIKLTELKAAETQAFDDVKEELMAQVSESEAQNKFYELQQELARLSFEFPDSLEDAAGAVNAQVKTSDWLGRNNQQPPFNEASVIDAMFSDIVLKENLNSDIIEVNENLAMVVRLNEYQEAKTRPLAEVSETIKAQLVAQKASEKAEEAVAAILASYKSGEDVTEQATALGASFIEKEAITRFSADVDSAISRLAFTLPHPVEGKVSADTVALRNGQVAVVEVTGVYEGLVSPALDNMIEQQGASLSQASYIAYVESLRAKAKITRKTLTEPANVF
ncbi:SurA N-terminal domain-containing protein [Thalassotalea sp. LPB0316]|uniref:SurA N-terminal domain-containing protein n=1 Tax=Thalassotalea sp. LPB0316 TaxID=2769490 RepID=UPI0018668003|nr:SurA N-terminal domain-containing protein [Thalassotalea sp. LPB0316]QOL24392.1 SurA N-terminal domain-containing protein [Thalassotalea sp. LPB0316]